MDMLFGNIFFNSCNAVLYLLTIHNREVSLILLISSRLNNNWI